MDAANLRRTLERAGLDATAVDQMIETLAPAIAAIERERGTVEADLVWAMVATQADIWAKQRDRGVRRRA